MKRISISILTAAGWAAMALGLAACGQNPFPTDGKVQLGQLNQEKFTLEAPERVECVSGEVCAFDVKASVLEDMGSPVVVAADLPAGAKFSLFTGHFKWTPLLMDREADRTVTVYVLVASSNEPARFGLARPITIHVIAGATSK